MEQWGRPLIIAGVLIVIVGVFLTYGPKLPFRLGRLPLDFRFERSNFGFYFLFVSFFFFFIIVTIILKLLTKR